MKKIDPYNNKQKYEEWKSKGMIIEGISDKNLDIITRYLQDMEQGLNVSKASKKGSRSFGRLLVLRNRIKRISQLLSQHKGIEDLTKATEEQVTQMFNEMRTGQILSNGNKPYKATRDYVTTFTAFWHWWVKVNRKQGIEIQDITEDLDKSREKPKWVYIDEDQFKLLLNHAKYNYKVLMSFLWDSGIRSPTELINIRISDLEQTNGSDYFMLNVREDISKTYGRRIKLLLCSKLLKEYVGSKGLKDSDQLFNICPRVTNQYLGRLANKVFGSGVSKAGEPYSKLTMYDFRHCSCCYWLPRYKSESALKYRFGWKKSEKIHYYSEFLGMKDTITPEDLLIDVTATEMQKQLWNEKQNRELLEERFKALEQDKNRNDKVLLIIKRLSEDNPDLMTELVKSIQKLKKN